MTADLLELPKVTPHPLVAAAAARVAFLAALRAVVGRRCPRNKAGIPLVSDYDLVWASDAERAEAWQAMASAGSGTVWSQN